MRVDTRPGRGKVEVGPPGGPTEAIPSSFKITITDTVPYDVEARLEWSADDGRLSIRQLTYTSLPGGEEVLPSTISRMALREAVRTDLEVEILGARGWFGLIDKYQDEDPVAVDALVYLLAVALESPKPSATVALARGLSPASGPKRVADARRAGLIPATQPGKASGAT